MNDPTCCVKANTCDGGRFGEQKLKCGDGSVFDEGKATTECKGTDGAKCTFENDFQNQGSTCCKEKSE